MNHKALAKPEDKLLKELQSLQQNLSAKPDDWELRKRVIQAQYNAGRFEDAADTVWSAPEIPPVDLEISFSIRALAKGQPRKALRLCHAVLEQNQGKPIKNLAIANALLHHGMVMLAARFYGAAYAEEPSYGDPEFEFWLLYVDDSQKLWGDWNEKDKKIEELPWMSSNEQLIDELSDPDALKLTTPIKLPTLPASSAESLKDISHVKHSNTEGDGPLPPPSIQLKPEAVAALGENAEIPGQRKQNDSAAKPSEAQASPKPATDQVAKPKAPTFPSPPVIQKAASTGKKEAPILKSPKVQETPSDKTKTAPPTPKGPSIKLPSIKKD